MSRALADIDLMPCGIVHRPDCRRLVGVCELTHAHTHPPHTHNQAAWPHFMEAGLCLHGTKVASLCQRLTVALAHTPECSPAVFCCDVVKHAQHLYLHTPAMTP